MMAKGVNNSNYGYIAIINPDLKFDIPFLKSAIWSQQSFSIAHCGDTIACTAAADCTSSTQKCMDIDGVNKACVNVCTTDADCGGTPGSCATTTTGDVGGTTGFSVCPFVIQQCLTDAECSTADPTLPVCNLYTLICEPDTTIITTTTVDGLTTHKKIFPHFLQFIYNLFIWNN
uniref:Disintegrin domain-containing protein n=1 Tax=Strongyloides venezuelensis TaxID=75913 RepID=A0A0K0EWL7_STRVS